MSRMDTPDSATPEPAWEVAQLFPAQGHWTESDFFRIHTNRMAELVSGRLEVLPMPTWLHQLIVRFLSARLLKHIQDEALPGDVLFAPLPIRLFPGTIREPDILFVTPEHFPSEPNGYPGRPDLVMEVVSQGAEARKRDYEDKRSDYAQARIPEYWIIDFEHSSIVVFTLVGDSYQEFSRSEGNAPAQSKRLPGFSVPFTDIQSLSKK